MNVCFNVAEDVKLIYKSESCSNVQSILSSLLPSSLCGRELFSYGSIYLTHCYFPHFSPFYVAMVNIAKKSYSLQGGDDGSNNESNRLWLAVSQ